MAVAQRCRSDGRTTPEGSGCLAVQRARRRLLAALSLTGANVCTYAAQIPRVVRVGPRQDFVWKADNVPRNDRFNRPMTNLRKSSCLEKAVSASLPPKLVVNLPPLGAPAVKRILSLFVLCAPLISYSHAGVVFEIETQDNDRNPPRSETTQVHAEGRLLRMNVQGSLGKHDDVVIFRGDRREMVVVDHDRKSYLVIDQGTMQNMLGQVNQAMSQMQEALKTISENQRAIVEQTMKQKMPAGQPQPKVKPVVRKVGQRATVYGYPSELFEVLRDGRKIRDIWVTDWANIEGGSELVQGFSDMGDFFQQLGDTLPELAGTEMQDNGFATMRQLGGFPVASREYREDGTVESESALRSSQRQHIDPNAFEPPPGYERQSMFPGGSGSSEVGVGRYPQRR